MSKKEPKPAELDPESVVQSRRKADYGVVYIGSGEWRPGECIPMRLAEAWGREDCEPIDDSGNVIDAPEVPEPELTEELSEEDSIFGGDSNG